MRCPKPTTVDFETFGIKGRPDYPPVPVGVSIKYWGKKPRYYAWGHPTGNNCTRAEAVAALKEAYATKDGLLFQNAKFDLDVAETHLKVALPAGEVATKVHDTMFLLFLDNPHESELSLKPSAERLLGMPPEEQDAVADWLLANQPVPGVKISKAKGSEHYFGAYIALAPADIVGSYANGDVIRTEKLFALLYPKTVERGMLGAYQRELNLLPVLLEMEREGLPIALDTLRSDVAMYRALQTTIDKWVIKTIKAPADINLDSGAQLVAAMIASGKADESLMPLTPTGKIQTNKESLLLGVTDKQLLAVLKYRTQLNTCLNTFMTPWLVTAEKSGGKIFTQWNQIKSPKGADGNAGARTGRLSSSPNFQNIPKEFKPIFHHEAPKTKLPKSPFKDLPPLPKVRNYIIPGESYVFVDRDYSQQEPRILAHFDGGEILAKYAQNPWIDFHDFARDELIKLGKTYDRKIIKGINLGLIYGMGVGKLAEQSALPVDETKGLKSAVLKLYPGLKEMYADMKARAKANLPIRTWGGREYYCEPAKLINGRVQEFDYKMVNVLVQGSAADCTKEALIRFHHIKKKSWRIVLNVHDQITVSCPIKELKKCMEVLRSAMESIEFDVPMLSEGAVSGVSWGELLDYDKKGVLV